MHKGSSLWRRSTVVLTLLSAACGSRSGLDGFVAAGPSVDASPSDAAGVEDTAAVDAPSDVHVLPGCFGAAQTLLAAEQGAVSAIAIDATHVYWAAPGSSCNDGAIRRMAKSGGPIETLASGQPNPRAIAVDESRVYFYDGCGTGLLRNVPKSGGAVYDYGVATGGNAEVIAVDSENVYFNDYGVLRVPKAGGKQVELDNANYVYALTADEAGVYWIGLTGGTAPYNVFAWHQGDAAPTLLGTSGQIGTDVAIDPTTIFFGTSPGISRMPRTGGPISSVVTAPAWRVAVDEAFVYWTDGFTGGDYTVNKIAKSGGGATTMIASGSGGYVDLAVDERCVYWANMYGGTIERAPK